MVLAYVQRRQEQRQCLLDLETLRTEGALTRQDTVAVTFYQKVVASNWLTESIREAGILRRLLGMDSPEGNDLLPAHLHP